MNFRDLFIVTCVWPLAMLTLGPLFVIWDIIICMVEARSSLRPPMSTKLAGLMALLAYSALIGCAHWHSDFLMGLSSKFRMLFSMPPSLTFTFNVSFSPLSLIYNIIMFFILLIVCLVLLQLHVLMSLIQLPILCLVLSITLLVWL